MVDWAKSFGRHIPNTLLFFASLGFTVVMFSAANPHKLDLRLPAGLPGSWGQVALLFLGVLGFAIPRSAGGNLTPPWPKWAMPVWILGMVTGTIMAVRPDLAWKTGLSWTLQLLSGAGLFALFLDERMKKLLVLGFAAASVGWIYYVFNIYRSVGTIPRNYFTGTPETTGLYNHNFFGLLIAMGSGGAFAWAIRRRGRFVPHVLGITILAASLSAVLLSHSRSSFLALLAACLFALAKARPLSAPVGRVLKVAVVGYALYLILNMTGLISAGSSTIARRYDFTDVESQRTQSAGRPELLQKGIALLAAHPLGIGPYNVRFTEAPIEMFAQEGFLLHNQYLTIAVECGWGAAVAWGCILWFLTLKPLMYKWLDTWNLAIFSGWLAYSVMALFGEFMGNVYWIILFASAASVSSEMQREGIAARSAHAKRVSGMSGTDPAGCIQQMRVPTKR